MSELSIKGQIVEFLPVEKGVSKSTNKEWEKQSYIVSNYGGYQGEEQIFCFDVFGKDKVEKLTKYSNVGDEVEVKFNIRTNEYKGKYYTSLSSYRIDKLPTETGEPKDDVLYDSAKDKSKDEIPLPDENKDELPF